MKRNRPLSYLFPDFAYASPCVTSTLVEADI
jgi:hypothetical protein